MITLDWTLAVAAAIFLITLFALKQLLFKPLFKVLDERKAKTSDLREETQKTLSYYESLFEQYQGKVKQEKQSGYKLAEAVREEALQERQRKLAKARGKAANLLTEAKEELRKDLHTAQAQLRREVQDIARTIAVKVLGRA